MVLGLALDYAVCRPEGPVAVPGGLYEGIAPVSETNAQR